MKELINSKDVSLKNIINGDGSAFNYFTAFVVTKVENNSLYVKTVKYLNHKYEEQVRIPGGGFSFMDIANAVKKLHSDQDYLVKTIEMLGGALQNEIAKDEISFEKARKETNDLCRRFEAEIRVLLGDGAFEEILKLSILNTVEREMMDEIGGEFEKAILANVSFHGSHRKITVVVDEFSGPDKMSGSAEAEVLSSEFTHYEAALASLFAKHKSHLRTAFRVIQEINPKYKKLLSSHTT